MHRSKTRMANPVIPKSFAPKVGDKVEVKTFITEREPTCWREGSVKGIKDNLISVVFKEGEETADLVRVRPSPSKVRLYDYTWRWKPS